MLTAGLSTLCRRSTKGIYNRGLKTGIVGLPNVGKSTLFNALVGGMQAQAANYPFCTIEPNTGIVTVPDPRLDVLTSLSKSIKTTPTLMEFVDIAGIVKGASEGAGLGNKFLSNIRQTDAIVHVVRCFEDSNIIHVDGEIGPLRDIEVINLELILADIVQAERRLERCQKDKKSNSEEISALKKVLEAMSDGVPSRRAGLTDTEIAAIDHLMLLTMKKVIYACNVSDGDLSTGNQHSDAVSALAAEDGSSTVIVSAQVESELCGLDAADRADFLSSLDVTDESTGLKALVREAYRTLGLQTFFTSGPSESRAWTIRHGSTARQAAGVIHSDFERGFIRAEIIGYDDFVRCGGEEAAKASGLMRSEGKEYIMQEGDIALFRFNV